MNHSFTRRDILHAAAAGAAALTPLGSCPVRLARQARDDDRAVPRRRRHRCIRAPAVGPVCQADGQAAGHREQGRRRRHGGRQHRGQAAHDGYTLFMGAVHHAIAPSMYPKLDYDLEKDFMPLTLGGQRAPGGGGQPQEHRRARLQVLPGLMRKSPGSYNYGSAGTGTSHHLAGELFKQQTKTFITHIPYTGAGPALRDLVGGQVDIMFDGLGSSAAHIKAGRIKALMVSGNKRNPGLPGRAQRGRGGPARLHRNHLVRPVGAQGHAGRCAGAHRRGSAQGRPVATSSRPSGRARAPSFPTTRREQFGALRNVRGQALGRGGEGLGRQAGLTIASPRAESQMTQTSNLFAALRAAFPQDLDSARRRDRTTAWLYSLARPRARHRHDRQPAARRWSRRRARASRCRSRSRSRP